MSISGIGFSSTYTPATHWAAHRKATATGSEPGNNAQGDTPSAVAGNSPPQAVKADAIDGAARNDSNSNMSADTSEKAEKGPQAQRPADAPKEVRKLEKRDAEVRAHEAAHLAAAGPYATGGMSLDYQTGPDGKHYAVGGDVSIDVSKERTPEGTISKMQVVRRAALAPASPSGQDRKVAADASQKEAAAQRELNKKQGTEEGTGPKSSGDSDAMPHSDAPSSEREHATPNDAPPASGFEVIENQSRVSGARAAYGTQNSVPATTAGWAM